MRLELEGLYEDIEVLVCSSERCRTMWMGAEGLDRLDENIFVEASGLEWQPARMTSAVECPRCTGGYRRRTQLEPLEFDDGLRLPGPPIQVFRCNSCNGFLLIIRMIRF